MHNGYYTGSTFLKFATLCRRFGPLHQLGTPEYPWKSPCMELGRVGIELNGETLPKGGPNGQTENASVKKQTQKTVIYKLAGITRAHEGAEIT